MRTPKQIDFQPKWPWIGGDLQTVRNNVMRRKGRLKLWPKSTQYVRVEDGSDDQLAISFNDQTDEAKRKQSFEKPLVCFIHGISGCEDSFAIRLSASYFLRMGFRTCRVNLRGAGAYRHLAKSSYHAGKSEDILPILKHLAGTQPLFFIGHSLGGNLLLKALGELGQQFGSAFRDMFGLVGAASLCAPVHMSRTEQKFSRPRNKIYHHYILDGMKKAWLATPDLAQEQRKLVREVGSVLEFDDRLVAPSIGLSGAQQYYSQNSALQFFDQINLPTLICAAEDDPWIPLEPCLEYDWSKNANLRPAFTRTGGHCGFHERGHRSNWFDRHCHKFIDEHSMA